MANGGKPRGGIDLNRREMAKSTGWLLLTASLGFPAAGCVLAGSGADSGGDAPPPAWGDASTLVSAIGAGTLAAASVAETVEAYTKGFGYVEHWRGSIPGEMAKFWDAPAMAGRAAAVVGPPGYQRGMIRIVELGADFQELDFHQSLGWAALEIWVRSPDEVVRQLEGLPFVHTGGPGDFKAKDGTPIFRAAQFKGPSGEPLYFTQHMLLDRLASIGENNVGPLFIQTLAAHPYEPTRDFYWHTLAMKMRMEVDTPRTNLVEALGLPADRMYKMAAVRAPEYCSIQIDEYPESAPARPAAAGCFPPGVSMCTLKTRDLNAVAGALKGAGVQAAMIESNAIPPFQGSRAIFCKGFSGERVEIVEVPAA
jgi:hypothetical protein